MKKTAFMLAIGLSAMTAYAGISSVSSNGSVSGVPSQQIKCSNGNSYIVYYKNGSWYRGDIGQMGDKFNAWAINQIANYLCK